MKWIKFRKNKKKSQVLVSWTEPKIKKKKTKVKVKITTEIKPPKKEKVKTRKGKRKNEINIHEVNKKTKNSRRESKALSVNQLAEKK